MNTKIAMQYANCVSVCFYFKLIEMILLDMSHDLYAVFLQAKYTLAHWNHVLLLVTVQFA